MRKRSDRTEIRRLRQTLRNVGSLLAGVTAVTSREQERVNYTRHLIADVLRARSRGCSRGKEG